MKSTGAVITVFALTATQFAIVDAQEHDPNLGLVPVTEFEGPALEFDFPGLSVGVAEYAEGPTGTTVIHFGKSVMGTVDVRGGGPGTMNSILLQQADETPRLHAISLSGGSAYGLGAAAGASKEIKSLLDDPGWFTKIAVVSGAIIFDLGGRRYNAVTPDEKLGRAAIRAMRPGYFPLGAHGAGRFAIQGGYYGARHHSGQGAAFGQYGNIRIAVFTVVNSIGSIVDRSGHFVRCGVPSRSDCPTAESTLYVPSDNDDALVSATGGITSNTTISLVVTNQQLSYGELRRLAMQTHTSMARAIQPFHTLNDGDTLFAVTTGEVRDETMSIGKLGVLASELAWDAVLSSVPPLERRPSASKRTPPVNELSRHTGNYVFAPGMEAIVSVSDNQLAIKAPDRYSMYLPANASVTMTPAENGDFLLNTDRKDVVRFDMNDDGITIGLTINPGRWPVKADKTNR
ncbi:MAG: P1 family peptidase [Woeseiaceae bacterium]